MASSQLSPARIARKLYRSSPEQVVRAARNRYRIRRAHADCDPVTVDFLRSAEYRELMARHVPYTGPGLHEAQTASKSFMFRHFEVDRRLLAFRWRGVEAHLDLLLEHLADPSRSVVDLGGAASPFGLGSIVVDTLPVDAEGRSVPYRSLDELPGQVDTIISSHTLEHIPDLDAELDRIARVLAPGGTLLVHVPAFSCERWRVGVHSHATFGDHVWTFGLRGTENVPDGLRSYVEIDAFLTRHFEVLSASYCGDDSIFIECRAA